MRKTYKLIILVGLFIALFVSAIPNLSKAVSNSILEINKPIESVVSTDNNSGNLEVNKPSSEANTLEVNKSTEGENKEDNKAAENIVADVTPNTATPGLLIDGRTPEEFFKPYEDILGTSDISYGELVTGNYVKSLNVTDEQLEELEINGIRTFTKKKLNLFRSVASFMGFRSVGTSPDPDADWPEITLDGNVAYCLNFEKKAPKDVNYTQSDNITYQNIGTYSKEQISLVAYYGYPSNATGLKEKYSLSDSDARINTQRAIWVMTGSPSNLVAPNKSPYANEIMDLAKASKYPWTEGTISDNNLNFTDQGGYYESQDITINGGPGTYTVNVQNGTAVNTNGDPLGSVNTGTAFRVRADKNFDGTVSADVTVSYTAKTLSFWVPDNDAYQNLIRVHDDPRMSVLKATGYIAPVPKFSQITVKKVDGATQNPLQGATIGLYKDGAEVKQEVTNDQGNIVFDNLQLGNYIVKEIAAPTGYVLDGSDNPVDATTEGNKDITLNNTKIKGNIRLLKKRADNNSPLAGAVFALSQGGQELKRETTNAQGIVEFNDLEYGDYQVTEITPPTGYNLNPNPTHVTIDTNGKTYQVEVINEIIKGNIKLIKKDQDGNLLSGAVFGLFQGDRKLKQQTTDNQGVVLFENITFGNYQIKEITPPAGYNLNPNAIQVNVDTNGKTYTVEMVNEIIKGHIEVLKVDEEDPTNMLKGAVFGLFKDDVKIKEVTTGDNGIARFENLVFGNYKVKELKSPVGFLLNTKVFDVNVDTQGKTYNVTVNDAPIKAPVEITKIDKMTNMFIPGVKFELRQNGKVLETLTTNDRGYVKSKDYRYGDYELVEIEAPPMYELDTTPIPVEIRGDKASVKLTIPNIPKVTLVTINKTSEHNEPIEGVRYLISNNTTNQEVITDKAGKASITLLYGDYTVKELSAPRKFVVDSLPKTLMVRGEKETELNYINNIKKGRVKVIKMDDINKQFLEGVTFDIFKDDNTKVGSIVTGKDGSATSELLEYGSYYLKEKAPLKDYLPNETQYKFDILENEQVVTINVYNSPKLGKIELHKTDAENGQGIEGIQFGVFDSNNKQIDTLTTDVNGVAYSRDLRMGKYTVKELGTKPEYLLNTKVFDVTLTDHKEVVKVDVTNIPVKGYVDLYKVDFDENNKPIEGAEFTLFADKECTKPLETLVTDANGYAKSKAYRYGKYYLKETKVSKEYWMDESVREVNITENDKTYTFNITNEIRKSIISILKRDEVTGELLKGVTFKVSCLTNTDFEPIKISTNGDGIARTDLLDYGTYRIEEVDAPIQYLLAEPVDVVIDGNQASIGKPLEPDVVQVPIFNKKKLGKLALTKSLSQPKINTTGDNALADTTPLRDIEFTLFKAVLVDNPTNDNLFFRMINKITNKEKITEWEQLAVFFTDDAGKINADSLEYGDYKLEETLPIEMQETEDYLFSVKEDGYVENANILNTYKNGIFEMYKTDNEGNPIEGVVFDILNNTKEHIKTCVTDKNGRFDIELPLGDYYYKEISVPNVEKGHYIFSDSEVPFSITPDATVIRAEVVNELVKEPETPETLAMKSNMGIDLSLGVAGTSISSILLVFYMRKRR